MLFEFENTEPINLELPNATFLYFHNFITKEDADTYFEILEKETKWQHDAIKIFGKEILQPRLTALYGNEGKPYGYSNIVMQPQPFTPLLTFLKEKIETAILYKFTTVLLNYYRNEKDSNGWHADNEKELGRDPVIASLSFGEDRIFQIKHNSDKNIKKNIVLQHGSLLIMKEGSQIHYKHQLPKSSSVKGPRINLTFRKII
jgi:alkylated DNA repair dioxygenase AlkB